MIYLISQIVIEALRGNGYEGDIAIDDVSVTSTCPAPRKYSILYYPSFLVVSLTFDLHKI